MTISPTARPSPPSPALVVYAYPSSSSGHGPALLSTVVRTLQEAGAPHAVLDLYRQNFQPVMSEAEASANGKAPPPDVVAAQALLQGAEVWIFIYPVWWSAPPAILKGWLDRVLTPGFAFRDSPGGETPLLSDKRALVVRTFGRSAEKEQQVGQPSAFMEKAVLGYCGVRSVSADIYSADHLAPTAFKHALFQLAGATRRLLVKATGVPEHLKTMSAPAKSVRPPAEIPQGGAPPEDLKPALSASAQADLEYFQTAVKAARAAVRSKPIDQFARTIYPGERGRSPPAGKPAQDWRSSQGGERYYGRKPERGAPAPGGSYGVSRPGNPYGGRRQNPRQNQPSFSGGRSGGNRDDWKPGSSRPPHGGYGGPRPGGNRPQGGHFGGPRPGGNAPQGGTHKQRHDFRHHGKRREHGQGRR